MKWPLKRKEEPRRLTIEICREIRASANLMELETAKEILAEIFLIRPAEVEEMIQRRLEERCISRAENIWPEKSGKKLWPAMFSVSR